MGNILSVRDIQLLCKRRTGKTQELIDVLGNALYNESDLTYGVCLSSERHLETFWRRFIDSISNLPGIKTMNKRLVVSENNVKIFPFTINGSKTQLCGQSFDDIFFDNPADAFREDILVEYFSRIKHDKDFS